MKETTCRKCGYILNNNRTVYQYKIVKRSIYFCSITCFEAWAERHVKSVFKADAKKYGKHFVAGAVMEMRKRLVKIQ